MSSLALPFGSEAHVAILWLTLLSFGALVYLTYRLGAELFLRGSASSPRSSCSPAPRSSATR